REMNSGVNSAPKPPTAKVAPAFILHLNTAAVKKQKAIPWPKFSFARFKLRVGNQAHRGPGGTFARRHGCHVARRSAHMQGRRMTGASKTSVAFSNVDDAVKHCRKD